MGTRPVLVADAGLAWAEELFAPLGELRLLPGREIGPDAVRDADALLVRSVTRVDRQLLAGSRVRFVGSATIGVDHLDLQYLRTAGITCSSAPGCNANAVVDYVCSAIATLPGLLERLQDGGRVAVVGCGNVGGRLLRRLQRAGLNVCAVDPWLQPPQPWRLLGLRPALESDLICVHTPLTRSGPYPTRHLFNAERLGALPSGAVLLNAGRGPVVDGKALCERLAQGELRAVLDVWENEPEPAPELVERVALGTPHIAGYSEEGKVAGSLAIWRDYCQFRRLRPAPAPVLPAAPPLEFPADLSGNELLRAALTAAYDISADDQALRRVVADAETGGFDRLRREYPLRREFASRPLPPELGTGERRLLNAWGLGVAVE